MRLTLLRPMLHVPDVKETIGWYESVLGFRCLHYLPEWNWGQVERDGIRIMFVQPETKETTPLFTGSFYFNTDAVDDLWENLKNSGHVFYGIENFEHGMREFAIKDCNGFTLQFGQALQTA